MSALFAKLRNLETQVNSRIAFKMLGGESNQKNFVFPRTFSLAWGRGGNEVARNEFRPKVLHNVGSGSRKR